MIRRVDVRNFKALRNVSVDLAPLTLVVGPNASGKSSILEGLYYLTQLGSQSSFDLIRGEQDARLLRTFGSDGEMLLGVAFAATSGDTTVRFSLRFDPSEEVYRWDVDVGFDTGVIPPKEPSMTAHLRKKSDHCFGAVTNLRLEPSRLAEPGFMDADASRVGFDGSNLAAVLADLRVTDPERSGAILQGLQAVVPSVRDIHFERAPIEKLGYEAIGDAPGSLYEQVRSRYIGYRFSLDFISGERIPAEHVSEGTLLVLGLLTILTGNSPPRLVLIDELERGLHPRALGSLVEQIRGLQRITPELQIIATTHSPYLVDHFQPDEIVLTTLDDDGFAVVGKLSEHPEFERWKDEMRPGEFWSSVGEDWLKERKSAKRD
jgi:predicted ATPase